MISGNSRQKPVTIKDIAAACGVSHPVVSTVLSNRRNSSISCSDETRERIRRTAARLGYRRNRTAASASRQRHGSVGILSENINHIPAMLLRHLMWLAGRHDMMLVMEQLPPNQETPRLVAENCVDAMFVFENLPDEVMAAIYSFEIPAIEVNTNRRTAANCLTFDEEAACLQVARLFADRGCRRPAFLTHDAPNSHYSGSVRHDAFHAACRDLGMAAPVDLTGDYPFFNGNTWQRVYDQLQAAPDVDCVLCAYDAMAPQLYEALRQLNRTVGDEVAVIGFNNSSFAVALRPVLTALEVDPELLATEMFASIKRLLKGGAAPPPKRLPYSLVRRSSH